MNPSLPGAHMSDDEDMEAYCRDCARNIVSGFRNFIDVNATSEIQRSKWAEMMAVSSKAEQRGEYRPRLCHCRDYRHSAKR